MSLQQGFLLTRHWRDTPIGTEVEFWLATDAGPQQLRLPPQTSVAFIPAEQRQRAERLLCEEYQLELKPLLLTDFHRRPMLGLYCHQHRQLIKLEKRLKEGGVSVYEADIRPPERYLMERFITALKVVQWPNQWQRATAQWPNETRSRLSPSAEAGLTGHRNYRLRRALLYRTGGLRSAAGLYVGASQRQRCRAGFLSGVLREPPTNPGAVKPVVGTA